MAQVVSYTCDECGKTKGEANHWAIACLDYDTQGRRVLTIVSWESTDNLSSPLTGKFFADVLHICGDECLHRVVSGSRAGTGRPARLESARVYKAGA